MEIDELKKDEGVDAILQIGFPGGYGFYGVADILSGGCEPVRTSYRHICC